MLLKEVLPRFLREHELKGSSPKTITQYRSVLEPLVGSLPDAPTEDDIVRCLDEERERRTHNGYAQVVKRVRMLIKAWRRMTDDEEDDELCRDLLDVIRPVWQHDVDRYVPSEEDVERLLDYTRMGHNGFRDYLAILLMAELGLRVGEVSCLAWDHVDLGRGQIKVGEKHGRRRTLPLVTDRMLWAFARRHTHYRRQRKRQQVPEPHYVASRNIDRPINPRNLRWMVAARAKEAGIDHHISPHMLRYYFGATHVDTMSPLMIQRFLGHSRLKTTLGYLNKGGVSVERMEAAFERSLQLRQPLREYSSIPLRVSD